MNGILMTTLIECLAFLELSGDDIVNPDAAIAQLETISDQLNQLKAEERAILVKHIEQMATVARQNHTDVKRTTFLEQLPESLGLI